MEYSVFDLVRARKMVMPRVTIIVEVCICLTISLLRVDSSSFSQQCGIVVTVLVNSTPRYLMWISFCMGSWSIVSWMECLRVRLMAIYLDLVGLKLKSLVIVVNL